MKNSFAQRCLRTNSPGEVRCPRRSHNAFQKPAAPARRLIRWLASSLGLFMVLVGMAHAGRYELVKGKGVEVCEAYKKNLNSFKPSEPMRCDRLVNPEFKDFQKPKWERIDGLANYSLIESAYEFLEKPSGPGRKADLEGLRENIKAQNEPYTFSTATVDIDNDGKPERVLRYFDTCIPFGTKGRYGTPLLVVAADGRQVDSVKTSRVMHNRGHDSGPGYPVGRWSYAMYDVFVYRSATYFDRSSDFVGERGFLRVFSIQNNATKEVCHYKYTKP